MDMLRSNYIWMIIAFFDSMMNISVYGLHKDLEVKDKEGYIIDIEKDSIPKKINLSLSIKQKESLGIAHVIFLEMLSFWIKN